MSDVREQLAQVLQDGPLVAYARSYVLADAILERFDVVEKPVVTDEELGRMAEHVVGYDEFGSTEFRGKHLRDELEAAGLRIVKVEAE